MLSDRRPILLANARIVDPSRDLDFPGDLLIADGVIREAKRGIHAAGVPEGTEVVDCGGRVVAPGLVDMRAFIGEPGAEYRETLASASQAAAAGGVTTIVCQPDTSPVIDDPAIVDFVMRRARDTAIVHVQPMGALTKGLAGRELAEIGLLKAAGAVAFTDGAKSVTNAQVMRRALTYAGDFDALVVHHTEDPDLISDAGFSTAPEVEQPARLVTDVLRGVAAADRLEVGHHLVPFGPRPERLHRGDAHGGIRVAVRPLADRFQRRPLLLGGGGRKPLEDPRHEGGGAPTHAGVGVAHELLQPVQIIAVPFLQAHQLVERRRLQKGVALLGPLPQRLRLLSGRQIQHEGELAHCLDDLPRPLRRQTAESVAPVVQLEDVLLFLRLLAELGAGEKEDVLVPVGENHLLLAGRLDVEVAEIQPDVLGGSLAAEVF